MDHIESQLDQLSELTDDQVTELQATVIAEFEQVEQQDATPESVDTMTALANMLDVVRGESSRREAQVEELATQAAEASMRVRGEATTATEEPISPAEEDGEIVEESPVEEVEPVEEPTAEEEEMPPVAEASTEADIVTELSSETAEPEAATELASEEETPAEDAEETPADEEKEKDEFPFATEEVVVAAVETASEAAVEEVPEVPSEAALADELALSTVETPIAPEAQEEAPVTAAADGVFEAPADRRPVVVPTSAPVAITAGADIPGYTAGSTITNMSEVSKAMEKRLHSLRRVNGGDGEQHIVASISTQYPESRTLSSDAESNWNKIQNVVGPEALIASGGHATPLETKYDVFGFGSSDRPVRDSLPRFQADRGGIRFITPPQLKDYTAATGIWTAANDAATPHNPLVKNSLTVNGAAEQTAETDAVTLQLQFGNLFSRAYPELLARHNELGLIQHARESEINLLNKISAKSTAVTTTNLLGFGRDFLVQVKRAGTAYRSRHRISLDTNLKAIIPAWVYDAISADLTMSMPGDSTVGLGESEINGYLASSNVTLTASLDLNAFGAQGAGALLEFPDTFQWYLFSEGSFVFLDGGTLDIGIIRDSSLVGTNDYKMFVESFEGVAFVGIESLAITSTINVNGAAAALRDTLGGVIASTIEL